MNTAIKSLSQLLFLIVLAALVSLHPAAGQVIGGVAIEFPSQNPIVATVATEVQFELVARDTLGNVITDWDTRGHPVTLSAQNSIAAVDTNRRSCYSWDDGYSWTKITVGGRAATQISDSDFVIDMSVFVNGRAACVFQDSKAEAGITIQVKPYVTGLTQTSPLMTFTESELENYMLEITGAPYPKSDTVYVQRLYELLVRPQDRYCNTIPREEPTLFSARFPGEFDASQGDAGDLFSGSASIAGDSRFLLASRIVREVGVQPQSIQCYSRTNPLVMDNSREYYILPHSPNPFSVIDLPDSTEISLAATPDSTVLFRWERPNPPDPYTNCYQSVLDPARYSDELRYSVFFFDAPTLERSIAIDSDGGGVQNQLTRTVAELRQILAYIHPHSVSNYERVLWRVEATDGLTVTTSNPSALSQFPYFRLFFLGTETDAPTVPRAATLRLHQNYPNPFNPATVIRFDLPGAMPVTITVTDALGREVAMLADQLVMEAGSHSLSFDAAGLTSGVYLYCLKTRDAVLARRMVVMK